MSHTFTIKMFSWLLPFFVLTGIVVFSRQPMVVGLVCSAWLGYMAYVSIRGKNGVYEEITQILTMFSLGWLVLLVESVVLRWFLICASIPIFFFLVWMNSERTGRLVHIQEKPLRRMRMMIHVFNMYTWCITVFAVDVFFPSVPFLVLLCAASAIGILTSFLIWRLYFKTSFRRLIVPLAVVGILIAELVWALRLLPFGYLAQGFLLVWAWYVFQLFVRFHLTPRGIVWVDQIGFVVGNTVLLVGVLFFIRWI